MATTNLSTIPPYYDPNINESFKKVVIGMKYRHAVERMGADQLYANLKERFNNPTDTKLIDALHEAYPEPNDENSHSLYIAIDENIRQTSVSLDTLENVLDEISSPIFSVSPVLSRDINKQ